MNFIIKLIIYFSLFIFVNSQIITTIIGNGTQGFGPDFILSTKSEIYRPLGVFVDNYGNIYIADSYNSRIRKIDNVTKTITTVAGTGAFSYNNDNILAINADLNEPFGLYIDNNENIYIPDTLNFRVRFVNSSNGLISTIAGTGIQGFSGDGSSAILAQLNYPSAISLDSFGNIYIADSQNNRIRKVDHITKMISTFAGSNAVTYQGDNIPATSALLFEPAGLWIDSMNNMYIADSGNWRIRFINASNQIITTVVGDGTLGFGPDNVLATQTKLSSPSSVAVDLLGNIYVADTGNNRIRFVNSTTGIITTIVGNGNGSYNGDNILFSSAFVNYPLGIFVDTKQNIYIADTLNNRIRFILVNQTLNIPYQPTTQQPSSTTNYILTTNLMTTSTYLTTSISSTTNGTTNINATILSNNISITMNNSNENAILIGILVPVLFLVIILIIVVIIYYRRRKLLKKSMEYEENRQSITINVETIENIHIMPNIFDKESLIIENIIIQEKLGEGNFGSVSKGLLNDKTIVALKQLKDNSKTKELIEEAKVLQKLRHPNIIQFFGIYYENEIPLLVMEFMDKGSLLDLLQIRKDDFSPNDLKKMAQDTLNGMIYLESKNIVHRDLAARNLLVSSKDNGFIVKISDFGLGKIIEKDQNYYASNGSISVKWSSPEVLGSLKFTSKSDVWSFGVVLWEIYTFGEDPYSELPTTFKIIEKIQQGYTLKPSENTPKEIKSIMKKCFETKLGGRPTFSEIVEDKFFQEKDIIQLQRKSSTNENYI